MGHRPALFLLFCAVPVRELYSDDGQLMHIILDANIYAADYRMSGVAFQSLFEYMRRTESQLVLPRATREEVVVGYGRELKREMKAFEQAWRAYRRLDLSGSASFNKPDVRRGMISLRRKLMKPTESIAPIYVPEIAGNFTQEAFMRGVHRTRPASGSGEELRDVILWLWVLGYAGAVDAAAFISRDGGFWDGDRVHPDIERDLRTKLGKLTIHRTIPDFLKSHAPMQADITEAWAREHFDIRGIERELLDGAMRELGRALSADRIRALSMEQYKVAAGRVYEVSPDSQFAELNVRLILKFVLGPGRRAPAFQDLDLLAALQKAFDQPAAVGGPFYPAAVAATPFSGAFADEAATGEPEAPSRELRSDAEAKVSVRVKNGLTTEISLDGLTIDRGKLYTDVYKPAT